MLRVGLTGGIGMGKSEVSRRLAAHGAVLIDADAIAKEVVGPGTPGLDQVIATFGESVRKADGELDRERLGEIVFADKGKLGQLNAIVHPLVGQRMVELEHSAAADAIVVHDVPLLAENDLAGNYDLVVVVDAPAAARPADPVAGDEQGAGRSEDGRSGQSRVQAGDRGLRDRQLGFAERA
jgi:dephospho-CoA kinase